jgi:uncharacterized protein (TIGR03000 family)
MRLRISTLLVSVTLLLTLPFVAAAQAPTGGTYTYRHGYNPGYYGSRKIPIDPGAKLGQPNPPAVSGYWYIPPSPTPAQRPSSPQRYTVRVTQFPPIPEEPARSVLFVAHVPEDAELWFEGEPTTTKGSVRLFESPPLELGKRYRYTIRVKWLEGGQPVSETGLVLVRAGETHCIDLVTLDAVAPSRVDESKIKAALAELSAEDLQAAEKQRFCALQQESRLGSMGKPVKILVKGQPVFFCCGACASRAESKADEILAAVKKLQTRSAGP